MAQKILSMDIGRVFQYVDTLKIDLKVRVRPPLTAPPCTSSLGCIGFFYRLNPAAKAAGFVFVG